MNAEECVYEVGDKHFYRLPADNEVGPFDSRAIALEKAQVLIDEKRTLLIREILAISSAFD